MTEQERADFARFASVARLYVDSFDEHDRLSITERMMLQEVEDALARYDAAVTEGRA